VLTKGTMCDIIDKHSSRERKTKDPTDGESSGFQANEESKHNIISNSSAKKKIKKI